MGILKLDFQSLLNDLASRSPTSSSDYYAVTLTGDRQGHIVRSIYSHWVSFSEKDNRIEIRIASLIRAEITVPMWREAGERCLVVDSLEDLQLFFLVGGHAVIEKNLSNLEIPTWLEPEEVIHDGVLGFRSICYLPSNFENRAPSPRLRMQVLKRDGYRCRICGRRPADNTDIELHVHHVRPWAKGGITIEQNLITLCHTCHNGLSPHYEPDFHYIVDPDNNPRSLIDHANTYNEGLKRYRSILFRSSQSKVERNIWQRKGVTVKVY